MGEIPKGWTVKPVDNAPPEGWNVQVGDPDFSDVQGSAASEPAPNTYQMSQDPAAGRAMGFIGGLPKGPELAAYIQSKVGNRQVSPEEMKSFLGGQQALTPSQYGQGEVAGKMTPSILAAIATKGQSLPQQAGAQGLTSYLQSRLGGKGVAPSALEGGLATGLTGAGGLVAKGIGSVASSTADWLAPRLRGIAQMAILKQAGRIGSGLSPGEGIKGLYKRVGESGVRQMAEDVAPHIAPTVRGTAENLADVVEPAEQARQVSLSRLDKALSGPTASTNKSQALYEKLIGNGVGEPAARATSGYSPELAAKGVGSTLPTVGDVVNSAKQRLAEIRATNPGLAPQVKQVGEFLDNYPAEWGEGTRSFKLLDKLRQQLQDRGNFKTPDPSYPASVFRDVSSSVRQHIDSAALRLDPTNAEAFLAAKNTLHKFIEPADVAAARAFELSGHTATGMLGAHGLGAASSALMGGHPVTAAGMAAGSFLQKPLRQFANYGLAKAAGGAANFLGSEAPGVGGFLSSGPGEATSGVAGSLMSKRLYPDQVGQLAERLGAPQAAQLKRAAETDPSNADALHKYMLANNQDYQAVMGTAGTSKDRRQP